MISWTCELVLFRALSIRQFCEFWISLDFTYCLSPLVFIGTFCPKANIFCSVALSIHQMMTIMRPMKSNETRQRVFVCVIACIFIISLIFSSHLLLSVSVLALPSNEDSNIVVVRNIHFFQWMDLIPTTFINSMCGLISAIIIICCTSVSLYGLLYLEKSKRSGVQLRVFISGLWLCLMSLLYSAYQMSILYALVITDDDLEVSHVNKFRGLMIDICYLSPAWVILAVNKGIRSQLKKIFLKVNPL